MAVADRKEGNFFSLHEFLYEDLTSRVAEDAIAEHRIDGPLGFSGAQSYDNALSGRESRCLDHDGRREIGERCLCLLRVAVLTGPRGRDSSAAHQLLREPLRSLDARCFARGPEN